MEGNQKNMTDLFSLSKIPVYKLKKDKNNIRILIVEDDKQLARALSEGVSNAGYTVHNAYDGNEAIVAVKKFKPNLILLDLLLPFKDGFEVLEEIKRDKKVNKIPIVILSNLDSQNDIERGKKLGADDYIVKADYSLMQIIEKIDKYFK